LGCRVHRSRTKAWTSTTIGVSGTGSSHVTGEWAAAELSTNASRDYEQARGSNITASELAETAAGATYARAYEARCEHALDSIGANWGGSSRGSLKSHGPFSFILT